MTHALVLLSGLSALPVHFATQEARGDCSHLCLGELALLLPQEKEAGTVPQEKDVGVVDGSVLRPSSPAYVLPEESDNRWSKWRWRAKRMWVQMPQEQRAGWPADGTGRKGLQTVKAESRMLGTVCQSRSWCWNCWPQELMSVHSHDLSCAISSQ